MRTINNIEASEQLLEALDFIPVLPCFRGACGSAATKRVSCKEDPEHGYLLCENHYIELIESIEASLRSGENEIICHPCGRRGSNFTDVADVIDI